MDVKTGSIINGGADSKISMSLGDATDRSVWIPNLKSWGLMGWAHNYFERGNLDVFTGRGPCIGSHICRLNLTSDGFGSHHGWYCNYVEVTSTRPYKRCSQTVYYVDWWLAVDVAPYQLTAVLDECRRAEANHHDRFIVRLGNPKISSAGDCDNENIINN